MDIPKFIKILKENKELDLIDVIEVITPDGKYIMSRDMIKGREYSEYKKTLLSGKIEEATRNIIALLVKEPMEFGHDDIDEIDPITYKRLERGKNCLLNESEDF